MVPIAQTRLKLEVAAVLQVIEKIPDRLWLEEVVWQLELLALIMRGTGGRAALELLPLTTSAVMGAMYIDAAWTRSRAYWEAMCVDYMAQTDSARAHEGQERSGAEGFERWL